MKEHCPEKIDIKEKIEGKTGLKKVSDIQTVVECVMLLGLAGIVLNKELIGGMILLMSSVCYLSIGIPEFCYLAFFYKKHPGEKPELFLRNFKDICRMDE